MRAACAGSTPTRLRAGGGVGKRSGTSTRPATIWPARVERPVPAPHREGRLTCEARPVLAASRGLARNVARYKAALARADESRHGDVDGRGALSDTALHEFTRFFLDTCIDQVAFMERILQPSELLRRMKLYVDDEIAAGRLPRGSLALLRDAFLAGEVERGRASELTGYRERRGRQVLSALIDRGLLVSRGTRAPVRLGFSLEVHERWFPGLYPVD